MTDFPVGPDLPAAGKAQLRQGAAEGGGLRPGEVQQSVAQIEEYGALHGRVLLWMGVRPGGSDRR